MTFDAELAREANDAWLGTGEPGDERYPIDPPERTDELEEGDGE